MLLSHFTYPHKSEDLLDNVSALTQYVNNELVVSRHFSRQGIEVKRLFFKNEALESNWEIIPDADGFMTVEYFPDKSSYGVIFRFDSKYNLIWDRGKFTHEYDEFGRLAITRELFDNGKESAKSKFHYDKRNRLILTEKFNNLDDVIAREIRTYCEHGLLSFELEEPNGEINNRILYHYNGNSDLIRESHFDHEGSTDDYLYKYNSDGKRTSETFRDNKYGGEYITTYDYNSAGQLISELTRNLSEISYEYDDHGSLTKKISTNRYNEKVEVKIESCTIIYFE